MTAPAISLTLRWLLSYAAVVATGGLVKTLATLIVTRDAPGRTEGLVTTFLTRILPLAALGR